jgi:hypothetical protein
MRDQGGHHDWCDDRPPPFEGREAVKFVVRVIPPFPSRRAAVGGLDLLPILLSLRAVRLAFGATNGALGAPGVPIAPPHKRYLNRRNLRDRYILVGNDHVGA